MTRRTKAPRPETIFADVQSLIDTVRTDRTDKFDAQTDQLIDTMLTLLRDKGVSENNILEVFAEVDPNNNLEWYKHFFKK